MVLFSFSNSNHIDLIKKGFKRQTTRTPRKPYWNGTPRYKLGDKVQLYYRSRQKKSCANCIQDEDSCNIVYSERRKDRVACKLWENYFGESKIIKIIHTHISEKADIGNEIWKGYTLSEADLDYKEAWAQADGFENFHESDKWFVKSTGDAFWAFKNLDIIIWDPELIIKKRTMEI